MRRSTVISFLLQLGFPVFSITHALLFITIYNLIQYFTIYIYKNKIPWTIFTMINFLQPNKLDYSKTLSCKGLPFTNTLTYWTSS
jgi:hypothetical protein